MPHLFRKKRHVNHARANTSSLISTFFWRGVNRNGEKVSGEVEAHSITELNTILRKQKISLTAVRKRSRSSWLNQTTITSMDITVFSRQVATMLSAGLPLISAIELAVNGHTKTTMRRLLNHLLFELKTGFPLSDALRAYPQHFDDLYVNLVATGELSGTLEAIFNRIANYQEKSEILKSKVKKALFYPLLVMLSAFTITLGMLLFVVPKFEQIFQDVGANLPAFTQLILHLSYWLQNWWWQCLTIGFSCVYGLLFTHRRSRRLRNQVDRLLLRIPIIAPLVQKATLARFAQTLATTFNAGVPIVDGLTAAAKTSGNTIFQTALVKVRDQIIAGKQMHLAINSTHLFPQLFTQMVMIGEESGSLGTVLDKLAHIYEVQVDDTIDGLITLIEPVMMIIIGLLIGGLIIAMYLPIFEIGAITK